MNIQQAINTVIEGNHLNSEQMTAVMRVVMSGEATPAQVAGFLVALRMKGEVVEELTAAAAVMRELSAKVNVATENLVDTCGTGGDSKGTFNVSTCVAFVAAAAGARVAKHGNRSVSSKSGSADVLEIAGVNLQLTPKQVANCIEELGIGFLFAPAHHSAMKHAIGPRKELGVRTMFNLLGPLTNPASAPHQVLGVFSKQWLEPLANVLKSLGSKHVLVVHADDGLDEISIASNTQIAELKNGAVSCYSISPKQFGLDEGNLADIVAKDAANSLLIVNDVFENKTGAALDIVKLNAGAALYASDKAATLEEGVSLAADVIASGEAKNKFQQYIEYTNSFK
ncbi:MAG: anthranilate phosphoribosyltransferase [Gammaproteobacteria bacterium]|nr:MAG: anthranilate phosphoribosyltransferase [Gammaproteobacteria bacterium]